MGNRYFQKKSPKQKLVRWIISGDDLGKKFFFFGCGDFFGGEIAVSHFLFNFAKRFVLKNNGLSFCVCVRDALFVEKS